MLRFPAGSYWLFVPAFPHDPPPGWESAVEVDMPGGTASLAWRAVEAGAETPAPLTATTLSIALTYE